MAGTDTRLVLVNGEIRIMKIEDGLKLKGRIVEIPEATRDDLAKFIYDRGGRVGAEIGVDRGEYGKVLCEAGLEVFGVDCWENYFDYKRPGKYRSNMDVALETLKGLNYHIIKKYSMDALNDVDDLSLDFVYIDANHTLPYVCQDIFGWERKVKKGGIVSGHDYARIKGGRENEDNPVWDGCHVKEAVDACANVMKIKKYYILGERYGKRDKWRSWMWIKE